MSEETQNSRVVTIACFLLAQAMVTSFLFAVAYLFSPMRDGKHHGTESLIFAVGLSVAALLSRFLKRLRRRKRRSQPS